MEGITTLALYVGGGALIVGFIAGLILRSRSGAATITAIVALAAMLVEHFRLNGQLGDLMPLLFYAGLAVGAFIIGLIGASIARAIKR